MKDAQIVSAPASSAGATKSVNLAGMMQMLNSASDALLAQAGLHRQLASLEWQQEKNRLLSMLAAFLLGFSCFICLLIFVGITVVTLSWNSDYQWLSLLSVCSAYALASYLAWRRFMHEASRAGGFFPGTRAELAADLALIKSKLS